MLNRRTFLERVTGSSFIAGGACLVVLGTARAQPLPHYTGRTDNDAGASADRAGYGHTGITDGDAGSNADRAGYGRGSHAGVTDHDTGMSADPAGRGRGDSGLTDTDTASYADPAGRGRGGRTGITDGDSGPNGDPAGRGRGGRPTGISDHDSGAATDRAGYGRGSRSSVTDSDSGAYADPSGNGRGGSRGGITDSDTSDRAGSGRRGSSSQGVTDSDSGANADRAGYGRDGRTSGVQSPTFPWPLPTPTERMPLPRDAVLRSLGRAPTLYDVGQRLEQALRTAGYDRHSFYSLKNRLGFALVAMLEHIRPNGRPIHDSSRWTPPESADFNLDDFVANLLTAPTGFYRVIVLVATNQQLQFAGSLGDRRAREYARQGLPLATEFRTTPYTSDYQTTALIYEYRKISTNEVGPSRSGRLDARTHLTNSGIYQALMR